MNWFAETVMLSHGVRRTALLLLAGAVAGLSVPPLFFLPALFIAFPVLVWALDGAEAQTGWRRLFGPAFSIGFSFGLGYFLVAIHWVGAAFFVDGGWLLAVMPFAVLALAAALALYWGLAAALAHQFWSDRPWRVLTLAVAFTAAEFARGHLLSGFPFDLVGYALTANDEMIQLSAIIGVYGLTFMAILLAALPALIWPDDGRALPVRLIPLFAVVLVIGAQIGFGVYRLGAVEVVPHDDLKLRLVQPAIPQADKWRAESRAFVMDRLMSLSQTRLTPDDPALEGVDMLVWPESAMPFYLADQPEDLAQIARMLPEGKVLVTGAPRLDFTADSDDAAFNSVLVINSDGEVTQSYDKTHLVPVGEYLPFRDFFRWAGFTQFVPGANGWSPGDARRLLDVAGSVPFLPLICYEAIFSGDLGAPVADAGFILNLTNDGWFDRSIGPAQHFHHARVRAAEEGRSLVRLANSGVTALVDPLGRVSAALAPGEVSLLDVTPQKPLTSTPFAQMRHWPLLIGLGVCVLVGGLRRWRRR